MYRVNYLLLCLSSFVLCKPWKLPIYLPNTDATVRAIHVTLHGRVQLPTKWAAHVLFFEASTGECWGVSWDRPAIDIHICVTGTCIYHHTILCVCVCLCACMCVCVCVCVHVCVCVCTCVRVCVTSTQVRVQPLLTLAPNGGKHINHSPTMTT